MSGIAQIILAVGAGGLFVLLGVGVVIWAVRCDPKRPHYRLPSIAVIAGPVIAAILIWARLR